MCVTTESVPNMYEHSFLLRTFGLSHSKQMCNHLNIALVAMVFGWQEAATPAMMPARSSSAYVQ